MRRARGVQNPAYSDEAAALMESLATSHAFIDGNKRISFVMADTMLRANGYFIDVEPAAAHRFITEALENRKFRFDAIRAWLRSNITILEHTG
ncbi:MAG: type II toxin-antitoxin system death-on-curing family toxin [Candidatus Acidiferrales bacterium]